MLRMTKHVVSFPGCQAVTRLPLPLCRAYYELLTGNKAVTRSELGKKG
jgi:hypothetical protein